MPGFVSGRSGRAMAAALVLAGVVVAGALTLGGAGGLVGRWVGAALQGGQSVAYRWTGQPAGGGPGQVPAPSPGMAGLPPQPVWERPPAGGSGKGELAGRDDGGAGALRDGAAAQAPEAGRGASAAVPPVVPGGLAWPAEGFVVSTAGWRRHPERGDWSYQPGLELAIPSGAPVRAAWAGVVRELQLEPEGYAVTVDHGGGWETRYTRLATVSVRAGARLRRGSVLGYGPNPGEPAVQAMAGGGRQTRGEGQAAGPAQGGFWWAGPAGASGAVVGFEVRHGGESVDPLRVLEPGAFRVSGAGEAAPPGAGGYDFESEPRESVTGGPVPGP